MVEVEIWKMYTDPKTRVPIIILKERAGTAKLPIWIGTVEAAAIAMEIKGREFQRPLTHDLLSTAVKALGGEIRKVEVASLKDTTYYARITIQRGDELIAIDARPSDSIALALRAKAPIFAARDLLTHELDDALPEEGLEPERSAPAEMSPEERAERIRRRIEEIDPEDFGKFSF